MNLDRSWTDYAAEEKLLIIESYLEGVAKLDTTDSEAHAKHLEWLREHLPAYREESGNYVFISYSHKDYKAVYHDLAFFLYNSETRLRFWYDEGLPAGSDWSAAAKESLLDPRCSGVIFYLSEAFLKSEAVREEIAMLKASGKPFITVALEDGRYSARSILGENTDEELDTMFPDENTALVFRRDYENKLYRIHKIATLFNVTESVMSDFICEEVGDGLSLVEYVGNKTEIHIPEKIKNRPIVEITAEFGSASCLFIPATVQRIFPHPVPKDRYEDLEELETSSYFRMVEHSLGGFQEITRLFGTCPQLTAIYVDDQNPWFYDKNGVLYSRDATLLRFPPSHPSFEGVLEGVTAIGDTAFADCQSVIDFDFPDTVKSIGAGAFANTVFSSFHLSDSLIAIGEGAFDGATLGIMFDLPASVRAVGEWAYRNLQTGPMSTQFLFSNVSHIPRAACFGSTLKELILTRMPDVIDEGAFALCSALRSAELVEGVRVIGPKAFLGCSSLTHVILPKSLTYIGEDAFYDCDKLKVIRYRGTTSQFLRLYFENPFLSEEQLKLVVCDNQPFRRLKAHRLLKRIEKARKLLED